MATFGYGNITNHKDRIGVWLRVGTNPEVSELIKKSKQKRFFDTIERILIAQYDEETGDVWLEVWCKNLIDSIRGKYRYNVFSIRTKPNPVWSCEVDLGKGYNENED